MIVLSNLLFKFFLLACLFAAVRAIIDIIAQKKCPKDEELKEVVLGYKKKNTKSADRIIRHLGICEKCQEKVKEIGSE